MTFLSPNARRPHLAAHKSEGSVCYWVKVAWVILAAKQLSWAAAERHPNWQHSGGGKASARFGHSIKCGSDRRRCESGEMRILPHCVGRSAIHLLVSQLGAFWPH